MFKDKILSQLAIKFPGVEKNFLGLYADKLQAKVTEESQIQGVIDELDNLPIPIPDLAAEFQKQGDARVADAKQKWLKNPPKPSNPVKTDQAPKEGEQTTQGQPEDPTLKLLNILVEKVTKLESEKTQSSIREKIQGHEKMKDVPAVLWNKRPLPEKEEDLDAFIEDVAKDHADFTQSLADKGFQQVSKPVVGIQQKGGQEKGTTEMDQYLERRKAETEAKKTA